MIALERWAELLEENRLLEGMVTGMSAEIASWRCSRKRGSTSAEIVRSEYQAQFSGSIRSTPEQT